MCIFLNSTLLKTKKILFLHASALYNYTTIYAHIFMKALSAQQNVKIFVKKLILCRDQYPSQCVSLPAQREKRHPPFGVNDW